ncbi:UNKNOWN [Stylonychia lemnae]|uniref:Transmembrane protein n=1 Tax=Stylonychia lemnae TaxID=5949 RepID=A0A078AJD0_STYLE|nr:UNKNOWN [Stylonychia lemnae]|eukprot:CDW82440.1 UNKNOWN [Stylonychia lemnae]
MNFQLLIKLSIVLGLLILSIEGKSKGKTYDDLQDMLNKANQKIEDEQERHHTTENQKVEQTTKSNNQATSNPVITNHYQTISQPQQSNEPASDQSSHTSTQKLSGPDNYKAKQSLPGKKTRIDELAEQLARKKTTESSDGIKLRQVSIPRKQNENEKLYFLLSNIILLLTCLIIVGAIFVLIYFIYRQLFSREQYFQFEDQPEMKQIPGLTLADLRNIEQAVNYQDYGRQSDSTVGRDHERQDDPEKLFTNLEKKSEQQQNAIKEDHDYYQRNEESKIQKQSQQINQNQIANQEQKGSPHKSQNYLKSTSQSKNNQNQNKQNTITSILSKKR